MNYRKAILINDTSNEQHIGCNAVIRNIKLLCKINGIEITKTFTRQDVNNRFCIQAIKDCDIVIINGEGSLHDGFGQRWLTLLLTMIPEGKKTVLINSVWHNMGKIEGINKLALISVRESNSYDSIKKDYPGLHIYITPDVIFYTELPKELNIGYGDSNNGSVTSKLNTHGNYFPLTYRKKGCCNYPLALNPKSMKSYLNWLSSLDLHITGRFHGVCLSAMAGTPFLAFESNARKIEGILKSMGCKNLLIKSLDEVEKKKELAIKLIPKAYLYAKVAKQNIEGLFKKIRNITYEK